MKFLTVLTVVAFVAAASAELSEETRAKLKTYTDECAAETGASPDLYDKFKKGDFSDQDKNTKCFVKCFYQKAGFFDKDDKLDVEVVIKKISEDFGEENATKWITPCKDIEQKDPCDKAFEIAQCFHNNKNSKT